MKYKVNNEKEYDALMLKIDALMKVGEKNLTDRQADQLRSMALAAQAWEKSIYTIPPPSTIEGMIELRMYEQRLKQKDLAKLLGTGEAKLSQILTGKRKPDVSFLKAAYMKLNIDPGFLLKNA
jgi:HTH-type transcriptional regulator/antitoxin HigA